MKQKIDQLQSLRAMAILMVAIFHYFARWDSQATGERSLYPFDDLPDSLRLIVAQGRFGVELFFLISGFVIALTLENSTNLRAFWVKRVSRLWPPLVVCLPLIWLVLQYAPPLDGSSQSFFALIFSFTLISPKAVGLTWLGQTTGVLWTLWVELQFYVLASLVFFGTKNFLRNLVLGALAFWALFILTSTRFSTPWLHGLGEALNLGNFVWWFVAGACAYKLRADTGNIKLRLLYTCSAFLSFTGIGVVRLAQDYEINLEREDWAAVAGNIAILAIFTLVAVFQKWKSIANPLTVSIGNSSYEFYLLHEALGVSLLQIMRRLVPLHSHFLGLLPVLILLPLAHYVFSFWSVKATRWTRLALSRPS
jgi:peptidoglycan/LPS O-acetylase OafA/YrhL